VKPVSSITDFGGAVRFDFGHDEPLAEYPANRAKSCLQFGVSNGRSVRAIRWLPDIIWSRPHVMEQTRCGISRWPRMPRLLLDARKQHDGMHTFIGKHEGHDRALRQIQDTSGRECIPTKSLFEGPSCRAFTC